MPHDFNTNDLVRFRWRITGRIEAWKGRGKVLVRIIDNPLRMPHYQVNSIVEFSVDELIPFDRSFEDELGQGD